MSEPELDPHANAKRTLPGCAEWVCSHVGEVNNSRSAPQALCLKCLPLRACPESVFCFQACRDIVCNCFVQATAVMNFSSSSRKKGLERHGHNLFQQGTGLPCMLPWLLSFSMSVAFCLKPASRLTRLLWIMWLRLCQLPLVHAGALSAEGATVLFAGPRCAPQHLCMTTCKFVPVTDQLRPSSRCEYHS